VSGGYLAVARLRKPHGLKGEVVAWALTDDPDAVLAVGRQVVPLDESGAPIGEVLTIERSRPFQRKWLLKFESMDDRAVLDEWRGLALGAPVSELTPPGENQLYEHEIPGATVTADGERIGEAVELMHGAGGPFLVIRAGERELMVPFKAPIVRHVDRATRTIELDPPAGLLEL
jgi:16S rRNA processing protein RimM